MSSKRFSHVAGHILAVILWSSLSTLVACVRIIDFKVSNAVHNGTSSVVLDCDFIYEKSEQQIVMKWYFNEDPIPVYQWIVDKDLRSFSDQFARHLDHEYAAPKKETKHRAIRLVRPTIKLTGTYKCTVSSHESKDAKAVELIVYSPARYFDFVTDNISSVICRAGGLYPSPSLELFRYSENDSRPIQIRSSSRTMVEGERSGYKIESSTEVDDGHLRSDLVTHYECVLSIPGTNYSTSKVLAFQKGWNKRGSFNSSPASLKLSHHVTLGIHLLSMAMALKHPHPFHLFTCTFSFLLISFSLSSHLISSLFSLLFLSLSLALALSAPSLCKSLFVPSNLMYYRS